MKLLWNLIWKYSETATPWAFDQIWWNLASQVWPNVPSTNLSSTPPTFVWLVNFIFPCVCKWNDSEIKLFQWVSKRDWTFKKIKIKIFFKQLAVPDIQICINRYLVSRRFARSLYGTTFSFWLIGYNLFAWSVPEKLTADKIHAEDKTS